MGSGSVALLGVPEDVTVVEEYFEQSIGTVLLEDGVGSGVEGRRVFSFSWLLEVPCVFEVSLFFSEFIEAFAVFLDGLGECVVSGVECVSIWEEVGECFEFVVLVSVVPFGEWSGSSGL